MPPRQPLRSNSIQAGVVHAFSRVCTCTGFRVQHTLSCAHRASCRHALAALPAPRRACLWRAFRARSSRSWFTALVYSIRAVKALDGVLISKGRF